MREGSPLPSRNQKIAASTVKAMSGSAISQREVRGGAFVGVDGSLM